MTAPQDPRALPGPTAPGDDDYSATVLASHWIRRPVTDPPPQDATPADATVPAVPSGAGEETVLRFGPGVTTALAHRPDVTAAVGATPRRRPRGRWRRYVVPVCVLAVVLVFLWWRDHSSAPLSVRAVAVRADRTHLVCDGTADVVGVVRTDGHEGTVTYRWVRGDGTASPVRHTSLDRGRRTVRVHLRWTFQGHGRQSTTATLRVLSPAPHTASLRLSYDCP
ncbi:hypothetical protein [Streptomyces galbus]|uniref:Uncharacterized protein n=1 Tax=Streptomyces galbus TaxID=33898 RepID=A0A4U5X2Q2_STRGB|nr:hypothetical protein [Streptomyces galbus]TKT09040.1 hypothetical protein E4U92_15780 [Streptomyces galbus]GHD26046.1 hypothetical protein GCM10010335_12010 [Streptomyces galbus]